MNPWLIFGPLGMILVGLSSILFWRLKRHVSIKYFIFGGLVWFIAIIPKFVMDYTVTPILRVWSVNSFGWLVALIVIGAYVGFRTGVFECGFTFLAFSKSHLREISLDDATAFGIGFGAFEAIFIAVPSLIQIAAFILNPSLLDMLPPTQRQLIEAQLSLPTWTVPAPIIERLFTLFVHLFTTLLIFISVTQRKLSYFLSAFLYKSILDALVPYIQTIVKPDTTVGIYTAEIWVAILGLVAITGTYWTRKTAFRAQQETQLL